MTRSKLARASAVVMGSVVCMSALLVPSMDEAVASSSCCHPKYEEWGAGNMGQTSGSGTYAISMRFSSPSRMRAVGYAKSLLSQGIDSWANRSGKGKGKVKMETVTCPGWAYHWWAKGKVFGSVTAYAKSHQAYSSAAAFATGAASVSGYVGCGDSATSAAKDGSADYTVALTSQVNVGVSFPFQVNAGGAVGSEIWLQSQSVTAGQQGRESNPLMASDVREGAGHKVFLQYNGYAQMKLSTNQNAAPGGGDPELMSAAVGNVVPSASMLCALFCKSPGGIYTVTQWDPVKHKVRVGHYTDSDTVISWEPWVELDEEDPDYERHDEGSEPSTPPTPEYGGPTDWEHP